MDEKGRTIVSARMPRQDVEGLIWATAGSIMTDPERSWGQVKPSVRLMVSEVVGTWFDLVGEEYGRNRQISLGTLLLRAERRFRESCGAADEPVDQALELFYKHLDTVYGQ